jgi:hypothetical protein
MKHGKHKDKNKLPKKSGPVLPFISVCTPTFNRRPFVPMMIRCFENQTYPKEKIEWIIVDDGTDKIEDMVAHLSCVKYLKLEDKVTLGKKRNLCNANCRGDIIVYMDDDDYYPPDRFMHAVEMLMKHPKALCAGSSAMFIYFNHIRKMYLFGPYSETHSTAATFAFKRELLLITQFDEESSVAEEKKFLKDYTIPFVQLDPLKSILVFSHSHNSFDKKELLKQLPNPSIHETNVTPTDIVKETELMHFFTEEMEPLLELYEQGKVEFKPDVTRQLLQMKTQRETQMKEDMDKQQKQQDLIQKLSAVSNPQEKINQLSQLVHELTMENTGLKEKVNYLEEKIRQFFDGKRLDMKLKSK